MSFLTVNITGTIQGEGLAVSFMNRLVSLPRTYRNRFSNNETVKITFDNFPSRSDCQIINISRYEN